MDEKSFHIDKILFERISAGDEEAFSSFVKLHHKTLSGFIHLLVKEESKASDILQEVFLKLWLDRATLADVINPGGWLRTVVANTTFNYMRTQLRYELRNQRAFSTMPETDESTTQKLEARFSQRVIEEAIARLPFKRRQVYTLSKDEGLSRKQIADEMGISENTVRNQLSEATSFVQDYLRRNGFHLSSIFIVFIATIKFFFRQ